MTHLSHPLGQCAPASVTKAHPWGGLSSRSISSHLGGCKSKVKVCAGYVPPEASLLGMQRWFSPWIRTWSSLCVCVWVLISSSLKDTNPVGSGSHPVTSFTVITSIKTFCKQSHPLWFSRLGLQQRTRGHSSALHDPLGGSGISPSSPACPMARGTSPGPLRLPGWVVARDHLPGLLSSLCPLPREKPARAASVCLKLSIPHGDACGESCSESVLQPHILNPQWAATAGELGGGGRELGGSREPQTSQVCEPQGPVWVSSL